MESYYNTKPARRRTAYVSSMGTTQIHLRNPYIIAWWSAAFPGFGHLLLSKYVKGFVLVAWEIIININANINLAIIHSFGGEFELAKQVLEPRWMLLYLPVYVYAIWDSYRTTVDLNKIFILADRENADFVNFKMTALEINYLDKRKPWVAVMWSFLMPGLGQLYIHRVITTFLIFICTVTSVYFSYFNWAIYYLFLGDFVQAKAVLNAEWFLFLPSIYYFSIYDAYVNTVENNKLFESEQKRFINDRYQNPSFTLPLNTVVRKDGD